MKFNKKEKYFWKKHFNINKESEVPEYIDYIKGIDTDHDDTYFEYLTARVAVIDEINLRCTNVTNEGVYYISKLKSLKKLILKNHLKLTTKSLEYINKLTDLEYLDLSKNNIGLADLKLLTNLKQLKEICISSDESDDENYLIMSELKELFPKVEISIY